MNRAFLAKHFNSKEIQSILHVRVNELWYFELKISIWIETVVDCIISTCHVYWAGWCGEIRLMYSKHRLLWMACNELVDAAAHQSPMYTSMQLMHILWKVPSDFRCTIGICWQSYQCRMSFAKRNILCLTSELKPWNQSNDTSFYCSNKSTSNKYLIGFEPFRHLIHSNWNCPFPGIAERFWMFLGNYSSVGYSMDLHSIFLHFKMEIQFSVLIKWNHGIHWFVILTVQWIWAIWMVFMLSTCILYKENIHKYGIS